MHIADDLMSDIAVDPLDALTDDSRAEMSYMERLCNICSTVVHNDLLCLCGLFQSELRLLRHGLKLF